MKLKIYNFQLLKTVKQFLRKLIEKEQILEIKITKSRETFSFKTLILHEGSWMIGLTSLEVYNSFFNVTEKITFSNCVQIFLLSFRSWN